MVERVPAGLHLLRVDDELLDRAGRLSPPTLRSLDALHETTALNGGIDVLVTYGQLTTPHASQASYRGSMLGVKVSVSLPDDDVRFLDAYAEQHNFASRSAALQQAVRLLRSAGLSAQYESAWQEWAHGDDSPPWETVAADGLGT